MWQQINAYDHTDMVKRFCCFSDQMSEVGKKCDLSDFDCGMIVGARQGGLSISETADLLVFSPTTVSRVCREWCEKQKTSSEQQFCRQKHIVNERGQRRRARLVKADRKVTVTQITTHYNSGMQKSISEPTTGQTSKWTGYSSRRPSSLKNNLNKYLIKCSLSVYTIYASYDFSIWTALLMQYHFEP